MNKFETLNINDGNNDATLYLLLEVNYNKKHYIFYLNDFKETFTKEDVYIGEIFNNQLKPVDKEDIKYLKKIFNFAINNINSKLS